MAHTFFRTTCDTLSSIFVLTYVSRGSPMHYLDFANVLSLISLRSLVVSFALVNRTVVCASAVTVHVYDVLLLSII